MPPKSKRNKIIVSSKENDFVSNKLKSIVVSKNTKSARKALSDKTNSASDDDPLTSSKLCLRKRGTRNTVKKVSGEIENVDTVTLRINEKLSKNNLKNQEGKNHEISDKPLAGDKCRESLKKLVVLIQPLKIDEISLADSRPKRICRLPSKFKDHSVSPNKYIPVQPVQASTPLVKNNQIKVPSKVDFTKERAQLRRNLRTHNKKGISPDNSQEKKDNSISTSPLRKSMNINMKSVKPLQNNELIQKQQKRIKESSSNKKLADTNNNGNDSKGNKRCDIALSCYEKHKECLSKTSGKNGNDLKRGAGAQDVYEFTYDPTEEPPPQKKKRKRVVQKKKEKTKPVFTMNYDKNVAKSMANLQKILSKQTKTKSQTVQVPSNTQSLSKPNPIISDVNNVIEKEHNTVKSVLPQNFNSFHVEDIVLDNETVAMVHHDINESPVNSPIQNRQPSEPRSDYNREIEAQTNDNDPLNLQDDLTFFDDQPAASSSINVSVRNPSATPWRAEYENLPIKWQVNTYVKPNMTPAFECSFIDFDNKKKHVYTNIVPEQDEILPEIVENEAASKLKQTSIISFFKEVIEKNEKKRLKSKSTPTKKNSLFEDILHTSLISPIKENSKRDSDKNISPTKKKSSKFIVNSPESVNAKKSPLASKQKPNHEDENNDKNVTYFGFDESEEPDLENISPTEKLNKQPVRVMRPRKRAILQDINVQNGPTRAAVKLKVNNNEAVISHINEIVPEQNNDLDTQKVFDDSQKGKEADIVPTNTNSSTLNEENSESVHLFEDLDIIEHFKPPRKSYSKPKKVVFRRNSESSDSQDEANASDHDGSASEEDNLDDLNFVIPSLELNKPRKKKRVKNKLSHKEKKEADAWAAGFKSMCEEVDHFQLITE